MTWDDYASQRASELAACRNETEFQGVLDAIRRDLARWKSSAKDEATFWGKLEKAYEVAPKQLLKEATAAAALLSLMDKAESLLAAARQGKK